MKNHELQTVSLVSYKEKYGNSLSKFYLPVEQAMYSALPKQSILYCNGDPARCPIVVLDLF